MEDIDNIHEVPLEKVKQMAFQLRHSDNNSEGKTLETMFEIAERQLTDYRTIHGPILVWNLVDADGQAMMDEIWNAFVQYATDQRIAIPSSILRPSNPHATQLFLRPSSTKEELDKLAQVWEHHNKNQTLLLGQVRYSTRSYSGEGESNANITGGAAMALVNMAIEVISFMPNIIEKETPHITIAYDPGHAIAVDSNRLWQCQEQAEPWFTVHVFDLSPTTTAGKEIYGIIQTGIFQSQQIIHQLPKWAKIEDKK